MTAEVTAALIRELHNSEAAEPILIRFLDNGELEVIPSPYLTTASWTGRGRPHRVLITQPDLAFWLGDPADATNDDYEAMAETCRVEEAAMADNDEERTLAETGRFTV